MDLMRRPGCRFDIGFWALTIITTMTIIKIFIIKIRILVIITVIIIIRIII